MSSTHIDHSRGRIEILDGDMFYSPNPSPSEGPLVRPPYYDPDRMIFVLRSGIHRKDFLRPLWFANRTGFLSFLTVRPVNTSYPFDQLARLPTIHFIDGQYCLDPEAVEAWQRLEKNLIWATAALRNHLQLSVYVDRPFSPWALGYTLPSPSLQTMRARAQRSREWFQIWMSLLSYFIARMGPSDDEVPSWYKVLRANGFDESWLNSIMFSDVVNFTPTVHRVGTFLDLDDSNAPPPEWFISRGIPVWYRLQKSLLMTDPKHPLSKLVPPSELMHSQTPLTLPRSPKVATLNVPSNDAQYTSWQDFFARRALHNERILAQETSKKREARLNRERVPPTKKTKVFEWCLGPDPEDDRLYRQSVRQDWLAEYPDSQKRYDAFRNEWDICVEFGPEPPGGGYVDDDDDDDEYYNSLSPGDAPQDEIPAVRPASPVGFAETGDGWKPPFIELSNPFKALALRYGFVNHLTTSAQLPTHFTDPQLKSWRDILQLAGVSVETEKKFPAANFFDRDLIEFFETLKDGKRPRESQWDLHRGNREAIILSGLLRDVSYGPSNGYLVRFKDSLWAWTLWLSNPVDVMHLCRVDRELPRQDDLGTYLVENGFRFRTLSVMATIPASTHVAQEPRSPLVPIRQFNHVFTRKDYDVYEKQRADLLSSPRARAFLLRGGIAWRLAKDSLSLDQALSGPSSARNVYNSGYHIEYNMQEWGDDDVSAAELNLLSGSYVCLTGKHFVPFLL